MDSVDWMWGLSFCLSHSLMSGCVSCTWRCVSCVSGSVFTGENGFRWSKHVTAIMSFISNLMPLPIWQEGPAHGPEVGDLCLRECYKNQEHKQWGCQWYGEGGRINKSAEGARKAERKENGAPEALSWWLGGRREGPGAQGSPDNSTPQFGLGVGIFKCFPSSSNVHKSGHLLL